MQIWSLDDDDFCGTQILDPIPGCVQIFIPGPPGPPLVDVGSILVPVVITSSIAAPLYPRQRSFISASSPVNQPTIPNPPYNGAWELYLYCAPGSSPITLNGASNIKLSGQCILTPDSILYLQWDNHSRYVEGGRNEI